MIYMHEKCAKTFSFLLFQELEEIHIDLANTLNGAIESHALLLLTKVSSTYFNPHLDKSTKNSSKY